jgi:hypothetical protein
MIADQHTPKQEDLASIFNTDLLTAYTGKWKMHFEINSNNNNNNTCEKSDLMFCKLYVLY